MSVSSSARQRRWSSFSPARPERSGTCRGGGPDSQSWTSVRSDSAPSGETSRRWSEWTVKPVTLPSAIVQSPFSVYPGLSSRSLSSTARVRSAAERALSPFTHF